MWECLACRRAGLLHDGWNQIVRHRLNLARFPCCECLGHWTTGTSWNGRTMNASSRQCCMIPWTCNKLTKSNDHEQCKRACQCEADKARAKRSQRELLGWDGGKQNAARCWGMPP